MASSCVPDHGSQYTGNDCAELCSNWNIDHTYSPIGRPTGNAVVERFIQTIKEELIWTRDWHSIDELNAAVQQWLQMYNKQRPHQALNWKTPSQHRNDLKNAKQQLAAA